MSRLNEWKGSRFIICTLLAIMMLTAVASPVLAASSNSTISVAYCGINLYVEGNLIVPKDAAGSTVEPFLYNGTTYLPVRAVSEAMGKQVEWDAATASVKIFGSATPTAASETPFTLKDVTYTNIVATYNNIKLYVDGTLITPKDAAGNIVNPFIYNGTTYLPVRAVGNALGKTVGWNDAAKTVYLTTTAPNPTTSETAASSENVGDLGEPKAYLQDITPVSYGPDRLSTRLIKPAFNLYDVDGFRIYRGIAFYNSASSKIYEVTYDLGGKYKTFGGELSISWDDAKSLTSSYTYILTILADNEVVYTSSKFHFKSAPIKMAVDIKNAQQLTFRLEPSVGTLEGSGTGILIPIALIRTAGLYE